MRPSPLMNRENSKRQIKALAMINSKGITCKNNVYAREITKKKETWSEQDPMRSIRKTGME